MPAYPSRLGFELELELTDEGYTEDLTLEALQDDELVDAVEAYYRAKNETLLTKGGGWRSRVRSVI